MANLSHIFGGAFVPPPLDQTPIASPDIQLREAIINAGLTAPDSIILDGKIHRFRSGQKGGKPAGDKTGWYIAFDDGTPAGTFGCWRSGVTHDWRAVVNRKLTATEEMAIIRRMTEARALRDAERAKQHETAADTVETIWSGCMAASPEHPYLKRKNINPNGARVTGDGRLVVPLFDSEGTLSSLQYIDNEGGKLYHMGGATGGCFWQLGTTDEPGVIYMAEGFATAATIHQATGRPCAIAYSASNLVPVLGALRAQHGATQEIVIVADLDKSGVGQKYAEQACAKHGARFVVSPTESDVNDFVLAGGDLAFLLAPTLQEWLMGADDFSSQPAPLKWIIRDWIQANALIMIHGPSGGGKTFITLDWILRISSTITDWNNKNVKNGPVIYLAGEGHHGLRGRIAGWKAHHNIKHLEMWISPEGVDLNTPDGYNKVAEAIRALGVKPCLIAVDTMHRHLLGDENSAQDAKTMLDACARLMKEFDCSVILVHHTGVSEEAQHRARGSSAWKGALDIEISVVPALESRPIEIVQRKSKDSELAATVYAKLIGVQIPNWFDDDGQPVTTAVVELVEPVESVKKDTKVDESLKRFKRSWFKNHCLMHENMPFVTREGMLQFLIENDGLSAASANKYCQSSNDKFIGGLVNADVLAVLEDGWAIKNEVITSAWMLEKNG
jgi:phage/plasmid primase-like uncharacterized protein/KaiC/GvpD/RAD55 family RecA-like ATPase